MAAGSELGSRPRARLRLSWWQSRRRRGRIANGVSYGVIGLGAVLVCSPLLWQVSTSLKAPQDLFKWPPAWLPIPPHLENYLEVAEIVPLGQYVWNSVRLCIAVLTGTLISNSMVAYGFARLRFPGRNALFLLLISPMVLPSTVLMVPSFMLMQRLGWYNTYLPLIVPSFFGDAFSIFLLRQYFLTIPMEMEDAARIDGAGFMDTYLRIILPVAKPALATVTILTFMWVWNDFTGPLIWVSDMRLFTLPLGLAFFQGSPRSAAQLHLMMAMAVMVAIPCVLVYLFAQRLFMQGIVVTGLKG